MQFDDSDDDFTEESQSLILSSDEPNIRSSIKQGGTLIFTRSEVKNGVELQDFEVKNIIGRGAFGKVYLVQNKLTNAFYAMKTIRKDLALEKNFVTYLKLEKDILYNVDHPFIVSMEYVF
jgi:serine/threonine protein kinase